MDERDEDGYERETEASADPITEPNVALSRRYPARRNTAVAGIPANAAATAAFAATPIPSTRQRCDGANSSSFFIVSKISKGTVHVARRSARRQSFVVERSRAYSRQQGRQNHERSAEADAEDEDGQTALSLAAQYGHEVIVQLLHTRCAQDGSQGNEEDFHCD